ncbi:hypothetical protein SHKM778_29980 [Streptomyces sp. KM77-8]
MGGPPGAPCDAGFLAGRRSLIEGDSVSRRHQGEQELGVGGVAEAAGDEAFRAARVEDAVVPAGCVCAREEHQVVAGEVAERHFRQPGQW